MMQNGFRRIALAQGLLPERLPSRDVCASDELLSRPSAGLTDPPNASAEVWERVPEMRVASPA